MDKVLEKRSYVIENVNHLCIGDPDYLDAIANKTASSGMKSLVFNKAIKNIVRTEMDISEVKYTSDFDGKPFDYTSIKVDIYCSGINLDFENSNYAQAYAKAYLSGSPKLPDDAKEFLSERIKKNIETMRGRRYYPTNGSPKQYPLGCDSAQFDITVNKKNWLNIHTGADGYYGSVLDYHKNAGIKIELYFDGGLYTIDDIEKNMDYLFKIKERIKDDKEMMDYLSKIKERVKDDKEAEIEKEDKDDIER